MMPTMGQPKLRANRASPTPPVPSSAPDMNHADASKRAAGLRRIGWAVVGAVIVLANLPLIHHLLRSAPEANVALPYEDHFESLSMLNEHYFTTGGLWRVVNGELFSPGVRNNPLWLKAALPQNVIVEFDARSASPEG